jgi:hypothetical protein
LLCKWCLMWWNNKQNYFNLILLNSLKNVFMVDDSHFCFLISVDLSHNIHNCIGGVMVRVLTKHAKLRRMSKDWLARNQNVSQVSIHRLLFQWATTIKIQLSVLVSYNAYLIIISLKINISQWYSRNIAEVALNSN